MHGMHCNYTKEPIFENTLIKCEMEKACTMHNLLKPNSDEQKEKDETERKAEMIHRTILEKLTEKRQPKTLNIVFYEKDEIIFSRVFFDSFSQKHPTIFFASLLCMKEKQQKVSEFFFFFNKIVAFFAHTIKHFQLIVTTHFGEAFLNALSLWHIYI